MKRASLYFPLTVIAVACVSMCIISPKDAAAKVGNKEFNESSVAVANVFPNPESGIMNLLCSESLQSPVQVKIIDSKGKLVSAQSNLKIEGVSKHKFIQMNANSFSNGTYKLLIEGANGAVYQRVINIQK